MWILSFFSGQNDRVKRQAAKIITTERFQDQDNVASNIGNAGAAEAGLLLLSALEHAHVGQKVALCSFNDGVEILIFEVAGDNKVVNPIEHQIKTDPTFPMENSFNGVKCYLYNHLTDRHPLGSPPLLRKENQTGSMASSHHAATNQDSFICPHHASQLTKQITTMQC